MDPTHLTTARRSSPMARWIAVWMAAALPGCVGVDEGARPATGCRNGRCDGAETCATCPADCGPCGPSWDRDLGSAVGTPVATGVTTVAGSRATASCDRGRGNHVGELIFRWVAPATQRYAFDTVGSAHPDTVLSVVDASSRRELVCNDDIFLNLASRVVLPLAAGQAVLVIVDGFSRGDSASTNWFDVRSPAVGAFGLNITPVSDTCPEFTVSPARAGLGPTFGGTIVGAREDVPFPCAGVDARAVSFAWRAPADGRYGFLSRQAAVAVIDGACDAGGTVTCSRPFYSSGVSMASVVLRAGQDVSILVGGLAAGPSATFSLVITGPATCGDHDCATSVGETPETCAVDCPPASP